MTGPAFERLPLDQPDPQISLAGAFRRLWRKGFTFTGRASRREFWFAYLATVLLIAVAYIIAVALAGLSGNSNNSGSLALAPVLLLLIFGFAVASVIPQLAVTVRRLHDANLSGAMYFVCLVPLVGPLILLIMLAQRSDPRGARFDVPSLAASGYAPVAYPPTPITMAPPAPPAPPVPPVPPVPPAPPGSGVPAAQPASYLPVPPVLPPLPLAPGPAVVSPPPGPAVGSPPPGPAVVSPPPPPVPVPAPAAHPLGGAAPTSDQGDMDATRISAPVASAPWLVELNDGRRVPLTGAVYLGRDPVVADANVTALCVPIYEEQKSMSKTHARLMLTGSQVEVTDLHSTNGTLVITEAGGQKRLMPEVPQLIDSDATVQLGDVSLRVVRMRR